jgi:hypothetical protein
MTGHLYRLPGTKLAVNTLQLLARLDFQTTDVIGNTRLIQGVEFLHLGIQLRHRLFKVQITDFHVHSLPLRIGPALRPGVAPQAGHAPGG